MRCKKRFHHPQESKKDNLEDNRTVDKKKRKKHRPSFLQVEGANKGEDFKKDAEQAVLNNNK